MTRPNFEGDVGEGVGDGLDTANDDVLAQAICGSVHTYMSNPSSKNYEVNVPGDSSVALLAVQNLRGGPLMKINFSTDQNRTHVNF